jgi:hypothetical protein
MIIMGVRRDNQSDVLRNIDANSIKIAKGRNCAIALVNT